MTELENSYVVQEPLKMMNDSVEWSYRMRRCMQEIIPGLFLGPYSAAVRSNLPALQAAGITHVICVRQDVEACVIKQNFPNIFEYLVVEIADSKTENIMKYFLKTNAFIENCLANGGKCLVHGNAGISRSATLVMAYVMQKYNLSLRRTFYLVQQRRFCVGPNEGFMAQLAEFEPIYQAIQISGYSDGKDRPKRKFDEVDNSPSVVSFCNTGYQL